MAVHPPGGGKGCCLWIGTQPLSSLWHLSVHFVGVCVMSPSSSLCFLLCLQSPGAMCFWILIFAFSIFWFELCLSLSCYFVLVPEYFWFSNLFSWFLDFSAFVKQSSPFVPSYPASLDSAFGSTSYFLNPVIHRRCRTCWTGMDSEFRKWFVISDVLLLLFLLLLYYYWMSNQLIFVTN